MIKSIDETIPEIYIGSTNDYKRRQYNHKYNCNNPNSRVHNIKLYRFIRSKGGFDKFKFEVIEDCEEKDKIELESIYYDLFNPELNTRKYDFDEKEYKKEYYKENKEKKKEYKKKYYKENKEKIKEYREINKVKIIEERKDYYEKNKEKLCCRACRCEITKLNFKKHCKTKKHIANQTIK